jgi:hypothetical protein
MKYVSVIAVVICGLTAACTIKSERTVVERPAPAQTVVYSEAAPPATTVYVPVRQ